MAKSCWLQHSSFFNFPHPLQLSRPLEECERSDYYWCNSSSCSLALKREKEEGVCQAHKLVTVHIKSGGGWWFNWFMSPDDKQHMWVPPSVGFRGPGRLFWSASWGIWLFLLGARQAELLCLPHRDQCSNTSLWTPHSLAWLKAMGG